MVVTLKPPILPRWGPGVEILALRSQVLGVGLPHQLLRMIPFLATILVMFLTYRRVRQPAFLGLNYDRESRTSS